MVQYFPNDMPDAAERIINLQFQRNHDFCDGQKMLCTKRFPKADSPERSETSKNILAYPKLFFLLSLDSIDDCRASVTYQSIRMVPAEPQWYIKRFVSSQIGNQQSQIKSFQTLRLLSQQDRFRMIIKHCSVNAV